MGQNFNRNDFYEADMALVSNDYVRAQKIFSRLLVSAPENVNLNFLNGLCLINLPGRKKESIQYLQIAAQKVSSEYRYGDPEEGNAPLEAIKYYAIACKANNDLPKAIELLNQYKSSLSAKEEDEKTLTDAMIESCYVAMRLKEAPVYFIKKSLGETLKGERYAYPVVNSDETMLFYAVQGSNMQNEIYLVMNSGGVWGEPVKITTLIGAKGECYPSSVSFDNKRLYITQKTGVSTDIYCSYFEKERWQKMIKLEKPVNGSGWDSQASETADGKYLYFSSDRKGGFGNMDLYVSEKDEKGGWTKPINLGASVNSSQNELMPVLTSDQTKLFFKSESHENLGGYDIFVAEQTGTNEWSQPKNIGYPINTTDDDIYFMPVRSGDFAYAVSQDPADPVNNDIFLLEIFSENHPRKFQLSGHIVLGEDASGKGNVTIEVINTTNYEKVISLHPDEPGNNYNFELSGGSYMINYLSPEYKTFTKLLELPVDYPDNAITIDAILEREMPLAEVVPVVDEVTPKLEDEAKEKSDDKPNQNIENLSELSEPATSVADDNQINTKEKETKYSPKILYNGKYTIQFLALRKQIDLTGFDTKYPVEIQVGGDGYYRYITGVFDSPAEAFEIHNKIAEEKFKDAFVREYNLNDYLANADKSSSFIYTIQILASHKETNMDQFKALPNIKVSTGDDGYYRYTTGQFLTLSDAQRELEGLNGKGYTKAFIKKIAEVSNYHK
jgi:hypothetical protein